MVTALPASQRPECVLVASDASDLLAARREVSAWAATRGVRLTRQVQRLIVFAEGESVREWTVVEPSRRSEPVPTECVPARVFLLHASQDASTAA